VSGPQRKGYDAVVIGAGVVGLSCAWRAARRGLSVLVVDRGAPGAGASGVAAGMLAPVTEADWGEKALLELNLAGAETWPAFAAELEERTGVSSGFVRCGALVVAADRDDGEELRRLHAFQRSIGLDAAWLSGRECRRLEGSLSPRVAGGIHAPGDHAADPRATVAALGRALALEGGELVCDASASVVVRGDRVAGVEVAGAGEVEAEHVVVATGAWTGRLQGLPPHTVPPVRPVKGQILRLRHDEASSRLARRLIRTPRCYVVTRPDGEVVVGATVEERGFDDDVTADGVFALLEAAREVLPDVG
jgi:glycine oxidase